VSKWIVKLLGTQYSRRFRELQIDGPTLMELTEDDLAGELKIENSIRRKKLLGHLRAFKMRRALIEQNAQEGRKPSMVRSSSVGNASIASRQGERFDEDLTAEQRLYASIAASMSASGLQSTRSTASPPRSSGRSTPRTPAIQEHRSVSRSSTVATTISAFSTMSTQSGVQSSGHSDAELPKSSSRRSLWPEDAAKLEVNDKLALFGLTAPCSPRSGQVSTSSPRGISSPQAGPLSVSSLQGIAFNPAGKVKPPPLPPVAGPATANAGPLPATGGPGPATYNHEGSAMARSRHAIISNSPRNTAQFLIAPSAKFSSNWECMGASQPQSKVKGGVIGGASRFSRNSPSLAPCPSFLMKP